jgi:hypothetical protein
MDRAFAVFPKLPLEDLHKYSSPTMGHLQFFFGKKIANSRQMPLEEMKGLGIDRSIINVSQRFLTTL